MSESLARAWRFCVVDELTCYFDSPAEPANVHLEAWLPGHLDPDRLRDAVATVLTALPRARVRRAPGGWWRTGYTWTVPPEADLDPVSVLSWRTEPDLDLARAGFLATAPPLDQSPPFRLLLASGPGLDSLILNANHAAFDGRSCLALMRMIAEAYGSAAASAAGDGAAADRGLGGRPAEPQRPPARPAEPLPPPLPPSGQVRRARLRRVARIAARPADRRAPGYGFLLLEWPGIPVRPPRQSGQQCRATVNDLLVAALIETVARWNAALRRPQRPIRITIPVDVRPPGDDELGNKSALCAVTVRPGDADADRLTVVSAQTQRAKQRPGRQVGVALSAVTRVPLPTPVKRRLLRTAVRCLGILMSDTSLLTNLGNITSLPCFGHLPAERLWFSTYAHMPRGLSVGAITVAGRLRLCFRYRLALLDDAAAAAFAATYADALARLVDANADADTGAGTGVAVKR
jgi:NRPS condensation-like uncharacterized protein